MGKVITKEIGDNIVKLYSSGVSITDISKMYSGKPCFDTVKNYLKRVGVYDKSKSRGQKIYSEEDLKIISDLYNDNEYDKIHKLYPELDSVQKLYSFCSRYNIPKNSYRWSKDDEEFLIENYNKLSISEIETYLDHRHTYKAISTKAIKMGLAKSKYWTEEEDKIFKENYSNVPIETMLKLLPNRTYNAIIDRGKEFGIKSYQYINEKYSQEQKQFIINNWMNMSDQEIADVIGKTARGVMEQRNNMKLYRINKEYSNYENLSKMFRGHIQEWKTKSMEVCNYCCIFTGSKDFAIHHPYGFNYILKEAFSEIEKEIELVSDQPSDYSKEQLDRMIEIFSNIHTKYPLGICVRKDIHDLFHSIYGSGGNTPEQWDKFNEDLLSGKYSDKIII